MRKIFLALVLLATLFWSALLVKAQTVMLLVLVIGAAMFTSGTVLWIYCKNATQVNIKWVVIESGTIGGPWNPVLTNKAIIGPKVFQDFPVAYLYLTNTAKWYRVRLANDDEIPQNYKVSLIPGSDIQPVIRSDAELIAIRDRLNRENGYYVSDPK